MQTMLGVQLLRDLEIDLLSILRRNGVLAKVAQVTTAGHDVGVVDRLQQHRVARWRVLAVAVRRHQHVEFGMLFHVVERGTEAAPLACAIWLDAAQTR